LGADCGPWLGGCARGASEDNGHAGVDDERGRHASRLPSPGRGISEVAQELESIGLLIPKDNVNEAWRRRRKPSGRPARMRWGVESHNCGTNREAIEGLKGGQA